LSNLIGSTINWSKHTNNGCNTQNSWMSLLEEIIQLSKVKCNNHLQSSHHSLVLCSEDLKLLVLMRLNYNRLNKTIIVHLYNRFRDCMYLDHQDVGRLILWIYFMNNVKFLKRNESILMSLCLIFKRIYTSVLVKKIL